MSKKTSSKKFNTLPSFQKKETDSKLTLDERSSLYNLSTVELMKRVEHIKTEFLKIQ